MRRINALAVVFVLVVTVWPVGEPRSAEAENLGIFNDQIPNSGVLLTTWRGGPASAMETAAPNASSFWVSIEGQLVGWIARSPAFVNSEWSEVLPDPLPEWTPVIVVIPAREEASAPVPPAVGGTAPTVSLMYPLSSEMVILRTFDEFVASGLPGGIAMKDSPWGQPISSATDGIVTWAGWIEATQCGWTYVIEVETHDGWKISYMSVEELYWVELGEAVSRGQRIASSYDGRFDPCSNQLKRLYPVLMVSINGVQVDPEPLLVPWNCETWAIANNNPLPQSCSD